VSVGRETRLPCCTEQVLEIGQHGSVNEVYAFNDKATVDCRGWLPSLGSSCSRDTPSLDNTFFIRHKNERKEKYKQ